VDRSPIKKNHAGMIRLLLIHGIILLISSHEVHGQWPRGTQVEETFHNLTVPARNQNGDMRGLISDYGEGCGYCHASHKGAVERPLWNRFTPTGPYRMYDDGLDMIADPQPTGNSLSCLSCHDGTLGLDEVIDLPNSYIGPGPALTLIDECEDCHSGGDPDGGHDFEGVYFDTDLRDTHPISVLYDPSMASGFRSIAAVEAAGLKFFDGKLQCMTCHDPHSQSFVPFLRISNSGGSFCLNCHTSNPGESSAHDW